MFDARGVGHVFGSERVLDGVDLAAKPGELVGLAGPNGAGKSTLLAILCGQLTPTRGTVRWGDLERGSVAFRAAVTLVTQSPQLDPEITGRETLELFAALYGGPADPVALLDRAALDKRVASYSGGMKRRLHVMVASLSSARLVGLDEPQAGLDREGREALWAWVERRRQDGATFVVASHHLPECDRVLELSR